MPLWRGLALMASVAFLFHRAAPSGPGIILIGLPGFTGLAALAAAFTLDDGARSKFTSAVAVGAAIVILCALVSPDPRLRLASLASAAFGVGLAVWLVRTTRKRPKISWPVAALFVATLAVLSGYAAYLVLASRDLMIADFMTYRGVAMMIARLADSGNWPLLFSAAVQSITQDYSWAPGLVPGLLLAATAPTSRAVYTFSLLAFYAAPAALALAVLARDCARRAGCVQTKPDAIDQPRPEAPRSGLEGRASSCERWRTLEHPSRRLLRRLLRMRSRVSPTRNETAKLALGVAAVFVAYPAAFAVAARGMPDVGGLVLVVCALILAERLARLLALRQGLEARVKPTIRRVAIALALTLYAMFAFRRWYAFAVTGIVVMLAVELFPIALRHGVRFRWQDAISAAALGALTLLALMSPVLIDWAPNASAHDYAQTYAGYRKPPHVFLRELGDWVGLLPALAALAGAAFLWARSRGNRLVRLTLGASAIAAALFLRIQTPYIHHLDLIAPAIVVPIAASLMLLFANAPRLALLAIAALGLVTLSPLARTLNSLGLAPIAGLPRAPRTDLDELERLKDWVDERARPDAKVCGLGSSYTFSGQLIGELWQLRPERGPSRRELGVTMPDVDTVDGQPAASLKDCAIVIVGEPVQTHLDPDYQQTVIVPSREMLTGQGIGAKFRRSGEVFHLENGVSAVVFERLAPLDDADVDALQARWRRAREALELDEEGRRR
ncbi:MAG TPA: hypothetical protein VGG77_07665 [Roseiarcus sp.]